MNFSSNQNIEMNQDNQTNNKTSKKIIIILIIFLLVVLVATYVVYSYYVKNIQKETVRNEFFEYLKNNELAFFMSNEIYTGIAEKVEKEDYESTSDIKLLTTMENNMFSKLDLSKFEFNYNLTKNNNEQKSINKIFAKYAGNDLLNLDFIENKEQFAIKSDEIVNKYVGINKSNIQEITDKLMETQTDLSTAKKLKNFIFDRENIKLNEISEASSLSTYANIITNNTSAENFSKKENVVVTMDSEQINTTEYTVILSKEQFNNILTGISETIENDNEILSALTVSNVRDFENEDNEILEYTDNENIVEISGEQNNFNTYLNWGEENVGESDTNTTNIVLNQVEANTVPNTNTVSNEIENQRTNTVNQTQVEQAEENTQTSQEEQSTVTQQNETVQQETQETQEIQTETTQQQAENTTSNNVIEEEDNVRTQGFIEVNDEEEESIEDDEESSFIIGENFEDTIKNIVNLSDKIKWYSYLFTGAKANYSQEEILEQIQKILSDRIKQNNSLIVKTYVAEDKVIKINFEIPETSESFDVEIESKGENEKYLNITSLIGKDSESSGYKVSFYKKNADADLKTKIYINKIHKNKINQKINIDLETEGTTNSKKYNTNANILYSDSDGEFKVEVVNSLNFNVTPEIEDLNNDNCLFIDTIQNNEELLLTRDAIKQKTIDVLKEKNRNLNIIEINNENSVVEQTQQNTTMEDTTEKDKAKKVLIQTISNKMGEYLNAGTQLKIEDLEGLEIPGYEVDISISSNLAIITVNGYKFKLDSDFNLSDS